MACIVTCLKIAISIGKLKRKHRLGRNKLLACHYVLPDFRNKLADCVASIWYRKWTLRAEGNLKSFERVWKRSCLTAIGYLATREDVTLTSLSEASEVTFDFDMLMWKNGIAAASKWRQSSSLGPRIGHKFVWLICFELGKIDWGDVSRYCRCWINALTPDAFSYPPTAIRKKAIFRYSKFVLTKQLVCLWKWKFCSDYVIW